MSVSQACGCSEQSQSREDIAHIVLCKLACRNSDISLNLARRFPQKCSTACTEWCLRCWHLNREARRRIFGAMGLVSSEEIGWEKLVRLTKHMYFFSPGVNPLLTTVPRADGWQGRVSSTLNRIDRGRRWSTKLSNDERNTVAVSLPSPSSGFNKSRTRCFAGPTNLPSLALEATAPVGLQVNTDNKV